MGVFAEKCFELDFKKLILIYLPTFRRKYITFNFLHVLISPIEKMYIDFLKLRKANLDKLTHTYQICSIRKRLNDVFDRTERRIKIYSSQTYAGLYLYTEAEDDVIHSKTKYLCENKPIYLRTQAELYQEFDFIVEIPNTGINEIELKAEIDFLKIESKRYQIIIKQ
ncbi:MAG: hypothetical protein ACK40Y_01255 [Cloacibacterium caeni]